MMARLFRQVLVLVIVGPALLTGLACDAKPTAARTIIDPSSRDIELPGVTSLLGSVLPPVSSDYSDSRPHATYAEEIPLADVVIDPPSPGNRRRGERQ